MFSYALLLSKMKPRTFIMKNKQLLILIPSLLISLAGCKSSGKKNQEAFDDKSADYYSKVELRNAFNKESELNFDDEITNGLDDKVWNTLDGYWENGGTTPHNGVRRRNIFYTKDDKGNGYVALKARGLYNQEDPATKGKPEGSCIETKKSLGPGRYEVYMAAMPREGGVTAMWTYKCESSEDVSQNEIDIEIGGGGQYTNLWCTSWTKKTNKATNSPDVSDICYMNDGKIHKYTFDWYTNYNDSNSGRVDWFIDEQFVQSLSGGTITDIDMPIWLGVWMPSWAGDAKWVEDFILVDRVSYTAFDENQYYQSKRAYNTYSPKDPSNSDIKTVDFASITSKLNKLSNPSFETTESFVVGDDYGWVNFDAETFHGSSSFVNDSSEGNHAYKITAGDQAEDNDGYFYQRISCSYEGFEYHLDIDAKLASADSEAEILIWQRNRAGLGNIKQERIPLSSTTYQTLSKDITMAKDAGALDIFLHVSKGSAVFDNAKLFKK